MAHVKAARSTSAVSVSSAESASRLRRSERSSARRERASSIRACSREFCRSRSANYPAASSCFRASVSSSAATNSASSPSSSSLRARARVGVFFELLFFGSPPLPPPRALPPSVTSGMVPAPRQAIATSRTVLPLSVSSSSEALFSRSARPQPSAGTRFAPAPSSRKGSPSS